MSKLDVLGRDGHRSTEWDVADPTTVDVARKTFFDLVIEGNHLAFRVDAETGEHMADQGEFIREFDESALRIILIPPMAGG